jgi:hypothetical protein
LRRGERKVLIRSARGRRVSATCGVPFYIEAVDFAVNTALHYAEIRRDLKRRGGLSALMRSSTWRCSRKHDIKPVIFGDIMVHAHRARNERVCAAHGLTPWGRRTFTLAQDFIARDGEALSAN